MNWELRILSIINNYYSINLGRKVRNKQSIALFFDRIEQQNYGYQDDQDADYAWKNLFNYLVLIFKKTSVTPQ